MSRHRRRIYLAGPDVFFPNARAFGACKVQAAADAGFEGAFPLDQSLALDGFAPHAKAQRISQANEALMRTCDLLIANLTPFRGPSMDCGTAFEVGFMRALERPVLGYTNTSVDYADRARQDRALPRFPGDCDGPDVEIEDFGLAENLMIDVAITESGSRVIRTAVAPGAEQSDLTGFLACLAEARRLIPSDN